MKEYDVAASANSFRIKDEAAFLAWAEKLGLLVREDEHKGVKCFRIFTNDESDDDEDQLGKGWPFEIYDEETGEESNVDFYHELAGHLQEGSVAVLIEAGGTDVDSPFGFAVAINSTGEKIELNLEEIYEKAKPLGEVLF